MATNAPPTAPTAPSKPRAPRGSVAPEERAHRAYLALRGLAADVYETENQAVIDAYGPALQATHNLENALTAATKSAP